jgi:hypothetical protein
MTELLFCHFQAWVKRFDNMLATEHLRYYGREEDLKAGHKMNSAKQPVEQVHTDPRTSTTRLD